MGLVPFGRLGQQLKLPQSATLALRAPEQIPYLYEQAFQWYESFDPLGELLERPNPTPALDLMMKVLSHLTKDCSWPPHRIHFFGFAQGGSVAVELVLKWWRAELEQQTKSDGQRVARPLGSVVSVSGPLLSYPTIPPCARHLCWCSIDPHLRRPFYLLGRSQHLKRRIVTLLSIWTSTNYKRSVSIHS
ncbi:hypothetical protein A0H81_05128 [Grifola frondosa]|uniref:Phospholipase/carboxylesterase/thioesterase domain-containing protein n=1 Tax=Grifola frondosa TaxID=5627 RepID=A0A1C7MEQ3_GRIFR|nr:hypothetical protein A0H81_05128 [Grifola frondosa]